jgi:GNAT superfamily N-acetyltransferase
MVHRVVPDHLDHYRQYFPGPHLDLVLESITAGNTAAEVWYVPDVDTLAIVLLWDKGNNVFYLAGECLTEVAILHLNDLLSTSIRPQALAEGAPYFKTHALSPSLEQHLPHIFQPIRLHAYPTQFYTDGSGSQSPATLHAHPDYTIVPIDRTLLLRDDLTNRDQVLDEIRWMWPSIERFYAYGFGTLAILQRQIICWCTAEYVSPHRCGIGITTLPDYQRQGIATATAQRFLHEARRRGLTASWECGQANTASVRVAEKLGLVCQAVEIYWAGTFVS